MATNTNSSELLEGVDELLLSAKGQGGILASNTNSSELLEGVLDFQKIEMNWYCLPKAMKLAINTNSSGLLESSWVDFLASIGKVKI